MKKIVLSLVLCIICCVAQSESGYRLWLRYDRVQNPVLLATYKKNISGFAVYGSSPTSKIIGSELTNGIAGLLGTNVQSKSAYQAGYVLAGTPATLPAAVANVVKAKLASAGNEGFAIVSATVSGRPITIITGNTDVGVLYGAFHFLRLLQTAQPIQQLSIVSTPATAIRILNHWDNLNRHVERGYAGQSIWDWHRLPGYLDQRYTDYAKANASIGINATVLTNVNANAMVITKPYLQKVAALANVFRPYGIKVYLTARFSAPIEIGKLKTADPLDPQVQQWWNEKVKEIYEYVPDFGGFVVKANSEGQPGPQNYKRSHADGANLLADALAPHGGVVMWRAFVYSNETPEDRVKQAYSEFKPLDGSFRKNVLLQVKNGPLDFQPREPFSPLFGAMPKTPLMMEFQITQEYLGQGTSLVYEAPMFKEVLNADTYAKGAGSTIEKIVTGKLYNHANNGIAGVANIGSDFNWTGHLFGQANWYTLGRLAWNPDLTSEAIANEWVAQTFQHQPAVQRTITKMMMGSHETLVNYMTPLGLAHIMGTGHHYGPAPWVSNAGRADWNPVYYHKADSIGLGFDRTNTGSNALEQYSEPVQQQFADMRTCPEAYLLWFHHVPWTFKMNSGRSLWDELCYRYNAGVNGVRSMQTDWNNLQPYIDAERFKQVQMLLAVQEKEATWWRNACLLYFQTFSKMPIPAQYEQPDQTLEYYKSLRFPYAPGNG